MTPAQIDQLAAMRPLLIAQARRELGPKRSIDDACDVVSSVIASALGRNVDQLVDYEAPDAGFDYIEARISLGKLNQKHVARFLRVANTIGRKTSKHYNDVHRSLLALRQEAAAKGILKSTSAHA